MLFKIWSIPVNSNKTIFREVAVAAMLGQGVDGKQEVLIAVEYITVYPWFHEEEFYSKVKAELESCIRGDNMVPQPDKLECLEWDLGKKIKRAILKNHKKKLAFKKEWETQKKIVKQIEQLGGTNNQETLLGIKQSDAV